MGRFWSPERMRRYYDQRCKGSGSPAPVPACVDLNYAAPCSSCGRRIKLTARGLYATHLKPGRSTPKGGA